jgi:hypothetical protein
LPVAARRPDRTPPQTTMAKASGAGEAWPPAVPPESSLLSMQPMPKPRPAKAPKAFAKLERATAESSPERAQPAASSGMQMAKLDPEAVPLPQPKPELEATPERESKPSHRASHRHHVRSYRKEPEQSGLLAFLQKLTTPAKPSRRRR